MYFPQQYPDIDYAAIFNGPYRMTIETETHTTLSVGGTAVFDCQCADSQTIVTEMDELLHVMISAGSQDALVAAEEMISDVLNKPDLARRLAQQNTVGKRQEND